MSLLAIDDFSSMSAMMGSGPFKTLLTWLLIAIVVLAIFAPTLLAKLKDYVINAVMAKMHLPPVNSNQSGGLADLLRTVPRGSQAPAAVEDPAALGDAIAERVAAIRQRCPMASERQVFAWLTQGMTVDTAFEAYARQLEAQLAASHIKDVPADLKSAPAVAAATPTVVTPPVG